MNETFGQALRHVRSARGLSQQQLGRLAHYSGAYVSDLERGRKRPGPTIAQALDTALDADGQLADLAARDPGEPVGGPWTAQTARDVLGGVVESALMDRRGFLVLTGAAATGLAL